MRIKRGTVRIKKRKNVLKKTKGFLNRRSTHTRAAKEALLHAGKHAYQDRRLLKRNMRSLWIIRLSAAAKERGLSYSELLSKLKAKNIGINRKLLSEIAVNQPEIFDKIVKEL